MKRIILALLATAISLNIGSALAEKETYPAAQCVRWNANLPVPTLSSSAIVNTTNRTMFVDCPITHTDFDSFFHSGGIESSWFTARDRNGAFNQNVCARLGLAGALGSKVWSQAGPRRCTVRNDGQAEWFDLGGMESLNDVVHYYLSVSLPPRGWGASQLLSYGVDQ